MWVSAVLAQAAAGMVDRSQARLTRPSDRCVAVVSVGTGPQADEKDGAGMTDMVRQVPAHVQTPLLLEAGSGGNASSHVKSASS
jgi:hypothetical protein